MCVCVRACALVQVCVCACACRCVCACAQMCVCAFGCCLVGANGCIPLTMLVDVCQCCCLLMFVCLPLSRHFPCCKTWWIKNLNLNLASLRWLPTDSQIQYKLLSLWHSSLSSIAPVYMTELLKVYKPTHQLRCSSNTSILVFPLCGCTCLVRDLFLMLHCLSGTFSLAKFDHQTHSHLSNHLLNLTSVWDCVCLCVRARVRVCTRAHGSLFWLCIICSLFCNELCAPISRNNPQNSALLLLYMLFRWY